MRVRIVAQPNPARTADAAGTSLTTLAWSYEGADVVEVRVGAPDGPLFRRATAAGKGTTGKWVRDGMVFYLQDVSGGAPLSAENTLATVRVEVVRDFAASGGHALILMYHRIADLTPDPWSLAVTPSHFAEHLAVLSERASLTALGDLVRKFQERCLPPNAVAVTFDDGYADNLHCARPLLERHGAPATLFVSSGLLGKPREFWWDELEQLCQRDGTFVQPLYRSLYKLLLELPSDERNENLQQLWMWHEDQPQLRATHRTLAMEELIALSADGLIDIGGHTETHPVLPALPEDYQRAEIVADKLRLEGLLGRPVRHFAYPHGRFSRTTMVLVEKAGFQCACAASGGPVDLSAGLFQLPRMAVEDWDGEEFARRLEGWLGPERRRFVSGGLAPEFSVSEARLDLESTEQKAKEMEVRLQAAEQMLQNTSAGLRSFQEHFDSALKTYRSQRAWQIMLAVRKAYTLLVRQRAFGRFLYWLLRFPWEKRGSLTPFEPGFPRLESYIPGDLDADRVGIPPEDTRPAVQGIPQQTKCDLLILPVFEFDFRFQRPQQLAIHFAEMGHRVFWVSPTRLTTHPSERPWQATALRENLWEVCLCASRPDIYLDELRPEETTGLVDALGALFRDWAIAESAVMIQLPFWRTVGLALRERFGTKLVFDCMDDWESMPDISRFNREEEARLVSECDLLVLTAQQLTEKYAARARRSVLVRNAADYELFAYTHVSNNALSGLRRPIVGYFGAIAPWLDYELLYRVIVWRPQYSFVLIGGVGLEKEVAGSEIAKFRQLRNVSLLGHKDYWELPAYLEQFDACIIPFLVDSLTSATDPVKVYEYFSLGKPVVATRMRELADRTDLLYLAGDATDFAAQLDRALSEDDEELRRRRISYAARNTWRQRVEAIADELKETFERVSILVVTHNNRDYVGPCFDSIARNTSYPNYKIIVVDNNSDDGTAELVEARAGSTDCIRVIRLDKNRGFAHANNVAVGEAEGDYLILLNIDTLVTPGWVERLMRHIRRDPSIGIVIPVTNWAGNEARINVSYKKVCEMEEFALALAAENAHLSLDLNVAPLFCALVPRKIWDEAGGLDERFEIGMFEDDDFSVRVRALGYRIATAEDCFIHHFGRGSFAQLAPARYNHIFERNRRHFEQKWKTNWSPHQHRPGVQGNHVIFDPVGFVVDRS